MASTVKETPVRSADLHARTIQRRAVEAAIWGMPIVNYDLMLQEMLNKTAGQVNQLVYWGHPLDWRNQTLTPNPDTLYFMAFYNTKEVGPIVIDIPRGDENGSLNGNLVTTWQMPLEDVGLLGADKGAGGKYLILPPGYDKPAPQGYIALQSDVFGGYGLIRSNLKSHSDAHVQESIAYAKRVRVYPLSQAANPTANVFTDAKDVLFDSTIRYDASFFESLHRVIQAEPWLERDRLMVGQLRSLGIEQGKPFTPDGPTRSLLTGAALEAQQYLEEIYNAGFPPFWEGGHWTVPAPPEAIKAQQSNWAGPDYPSDLRGVCYSYAYVGIKRLGAGQMYLIAIRDRDGKDLDGGKNYRLTVPPNAPVEQYWSVTLYDRQTHALIRNVDRASRSSQIPEMQKDADGSIDVCFGPQCSAGKEANWVPTDPNRGFEAMFRLYAPTKALFEKAWRLPDIAKL